MTDVLMFAVIYLVGCYLSFVSVFNHLQNTYPLSSKECYVGDLIFALSVSFGSWLVLALAPDKDFKWFKYGFLPKKGFKEGGEE